ncbi:MAG TPA: hypothetical protein VLA09_13680 [Longimicrobiales bacterium]|nr:hypothetical protein [Longimicrobiales bacterium]
MNDLAGVGDSTAGRSGSRRSGLGSPRTVRSAFAFSVVVHVLAVVIYPSLVRQIRPEAAAFPLSAAAGSPGGIEVIRVVEVDVIQDVERPEDPREIADVQVAAVRVEGPGLDEAPGIVLPTPGLTPAERLRPGLTDRRLWAPLPPEFSELSLEQREELLIAGRLNAWYDSVAAVAAADAAWKDWTFTDGDGGRWGVSEGQLHLGDITIPLPFAFDAPPGQRDYMWQWNEISRQGARAAVQETVRDRLEAIRERRDRERAAARSDTTGTSR